MKRIIFGLRIAGFILMFLVVLALFFGYFGSPGMVILLKTTGSLTVWGCISSGLVSVLTCAAFVGGGYYLCDHYAKVNRVQLTGLYMILGGVLGPLIPIQYILYYALF
jgi:hypothetical protein